MQPVNYGMNQGYPMYGNCFDRLTTNGIIQDDLVGYVTGQPSPYLQNYVAQRGGMPAAGSLPIGMSYAPFPTGQMQPNQPLPQGPIYNDIPRNIGPDTIAPKSQTQKFKQIVTGAFLTGLAIFGIIKCKNLISSLLSRRGGTP